LHVAAAVALQFPNKSGTLKIGNWNAATNTTTDQWTVQTIDKSSSIKQSLHAAAEATTPCRLASQQSTGAPKKISNPKQESQATTNS